MPLKESRRDLASVDESDKSPMTPPNSSVDRRHGGVVVADLLHAVGDLARRLQDRLDERLLRVRQVAEIGTTTMTTSPELLTFAQGKWRSSRRRLRGQVLGRT